MFAMNTCANKKCEAIEIIISMMKKNDDADVIFKLHSTVIGLIALSRYKAKRVELINKLGYFDLIPKILPKRDGPFATLIFANEIVDHVSSCSDKSIGFKIYCKEISSAASQTFASRDLLDSYPDIAFNCTNFFVMLSPDIANAFLDEKVGSGLVKIAGDKRNPETQAMALETLSLFVDYNSSLINEKLVFQSKIIAVFVKLVEDKNLKVIRLVIPMLTSILITAEEAYGRNNKVTKFIAQIHGLSFMKDYAEKFNNDCGRAMKSMLEQFF